MTLFKDSCQYFADGINIFNLKNRKKAYVYQKMNSDRIRPQTNYPDHINDSNAKGLTPSKTVNKLIRRIPRGARAIK